MIEEQEDDVEGAASDPFDEELRSFQMALERTTSINKEDKLKPNVSRDWVQSLKTAVV